MNVLLANGLIDSFLSFLNDSYKKNLAATQTTNNSDELSVFRTALFSSSGAAASFKRNVLLKTMLAKTSSTDLTLENRKRKTCEPPTVSNEPPTPISNKSKKSKFNRSSNQLANTPSSPPSYSYSTSPNNVFVDYSSVSII